jgi:ABC-type phosphate/phosphonate transport system ATPase subunit
MRLGVLVRRGKHQHIVLIGPRGNGKTVLCRRLERMAEETGANVVAMSGADAGSPATLAKALSERKFCERLGVQSVDLSALGAKSACAWAHRRRR